MYYVVLHSRLQSYRHYVHRNTMSGQSPVSQYIILTLELSCRTKARHIPSEYCRKVDGISAPPLRAGNFQLLNDDPLISFIFVQSPSSTRPSSLLVLSPYVSQASQIQAGDPSEICINYDLSMRSASSALLNDDLLISFISPQSYNPTRAFSLVVLLSPIILASQS